MTTPFAGIQLETTYLNLPSLFYKKVAPTPVKKPALVALNSALADDLGMDASVLSKSDAVNTLAGNHVIDGSTPIAMAYAGHQFGSFVPQLGDGRAILLGEGVDKAGHQFDIHLKGAGQTPYSRRGDGRCPLGPAIREYIVSEAMHTLGIPTTRSLAVVTTGDIVYRETPLLGAVLTRVASSHIRVGTFEYVAAKGDLDALKHLADYTIDRHYPECKQSDTPYVALFHAICGAQASLIAKWMGVGFIHGVMNTDNTTISGETIDYGPCAFMDDFDPNAVFSYIDANGRYAYSNQPVVMKWNLMCLAQTLLPLFDEDTDKGVAIATAELATFDTKFDRYWLDIFRAKLGLTSPQENDHSLIETFLNLLATDHVDFTLAFRQLSHNIDNDQSTEEFTNLFTSKDDLMLWLETWKKRLVSEKENYAVTIQLMQSTNPLFIPRNHHIEAVITAAVSQQDFAPLHTLHQVLQTPFMQQPEHSHYAKPPQDSERVHQTFCGT